MSKTCSTCKYGNVGSFDEPCFSCDGYDSYQPYTEKDYKQIYSELLMMYIKELDLAMGNDYNECDNIMRDVKKDRFMELLEEFKAAFRIELEKGE